jgi:para-nitrobenzyl esterase
VYELAFAETSGRLSGYAYHSLDVGMVWQHPHLDAANGQAEAALGRQIHAAWLAFIKGEAPAAPGLPVWPRYRGDTRPTMMLDTVSRVEQRPQEAELRLWDGKL